MRPAVRLHNFRYVAQRQFKHLVFVGQKVHTHIHRQRHIYTRDVPQTVVVTFAKFTVEKTIALCGIVLFQNKFLFVRKCISL